jgi:hypothetical protein
MSLLPTVSSTERDLERFRPNSLRSFRFLDLERERDRFFLSRRSASRRSGDGDRESDEDFFRRRLASFDRPDRPASLTRLCADLERDLDLPLVAGDLDRDFRDGRRSDRDVRISMTLRTS